MMPMEALAEALTLVGRGEAIEWERDLFDTRIHSTIRYADPASWIIATAVARALAPVQEAVAEVRSSVAMVVASERGPSVTIEAVAEAARANLSSPLRYPAANPGALVGVTCIAFGFRGPTLNLTMPPQTGVPVALIAAANWVLREGVPFVLLAAYSQEAPQHRLARCLALCGQDFAPPLGQPLDEADIAWLCERTESGCKHL